MKTIKLGPDFAEIDGLRMSRDELTAIRPTEGADLPSDRHYQREHDGKEWCSTGTKQVTPDLSQAALDALEVLCDDTTLAVDLAAHRPPPLEAVDPSTLPAQLADVLSKALIDASVITQAQLDTARAALES